MEKQNGIRAILNVQNATNNTLNTKASLVQDPKEDITRSPIDIEARKTINCYSRREREYASGNGACLPITNLKPLNSNSFMIQQHETHSFSEIYTVDFDFQPAPLFAHFVRINNGHFLQHQNPMKSMLHPTFNPSQDHHPNAAIMNVPSHSSIIVVWRTTSLMDHPMHLHGYKVEILAVETPVRQRDCTMSKCLLNKRFENDDTVKVLDRENPKGSAVVKDTFILPAGGVVVTRITTAEPALWFAHCHINMHREDGMAFIMNVGNYTAPSTDSWLPRDYPSCNTPYLKTKQQQPSCQCYVNDDAVLGGSLTKDHKCSRPHLCRHEQSQIANLKYYDRNGVLVASSYQLSNIEITVVILAIISFVTVFVAFIWPTLVRSKGSNSKKSTGDSAHTADTIDSSPGEYDEEYLNVGNETNDAINNTNSSSKNRTYSKIPNTKGLEKLPPYLR